MWFYVATVVDWTALQGTPSFSLFKLYSPHCALLPLWTSLTTHLSLQQDDSNNQNGRKGINRKKFVFCQWLGHTNRWTLELKREKRNGLTGQSEGQSPFSTVLVDLPQSHKVQFKYTCLYKLLWASLKKYNFTSHHCKIQFIHKTSELLLSPWLTKAEQKSARQAEHQALHTQEKTLRLSHPTTFTSLCQSWS